MHLKAMINYAEWKKRPVEKTEPVKGNKSVVSEIISKYRASGLVQINEADAKKILSAYGINTPSGALVTSADEAAKQSE